MCETVDIVLGAVLNMRRSPNRFQISFNQRVSEKFRLFSSLPESTQSEFHKFMANSDTSIHTPTFHSSHLSTKVGILRKSESFDPATVDFEIDLSVPL